MAPSIRRTKVNRPRTPHNLVPRTALVQRLNDHAARDVVVVAAPVGFGKTTLVAAWADQAAQPVAWLTLDEEDNDIARFLTYVIAAVRTVFPDALPVTYDLLNGAYIPERETLATVIVNEIDDLPRRFTLVLDDFHTISAPGIHAFLDDLLRHPSFQLSLLLATRADPPLALARLRAGVRLAELRVHDLRFSPDESTRFLTMALASDLTVRAAPIIVKHTEGWVAGMQLAALSLLAAPDPDAVIRALEHGVDRLIMDYLFDQVLRRQDPAIQTFLLKISILERISQPLAAAVVAEDDQPLTTPLSEIERMGIFLNALDSTGEWYALHALFRVLLDHQLQIRSTQTEITALHLRASAWFARNDLPDEALHHALAANDIDLAARLVIDRFIGPLGREDWRAIARWLDLLPASAFDLHPSLFVVKANVLQVQSDWNGVSQLLAEAEAAIARSGEVMATADRLAMRGYLDMLWALHWSMEGNGKRVIETARKALQNLPADDFYVRGATETALIMAMQATGNATGAEQLLRGELATRQRSARQPHQRLRIFLNRLSLQLSTGDIAAARHSATGLLQEATEYSAPISQIWAHLALGVCAYETNDLASAVTHFERGADFGQGGHVRAVHECLIHLAFTYQALHRTADAHHIAHMLAEYHARLSNPQLAAEAVSLRRHLAVLNGERPVDLPAWEAKSAVPAIWFGWRELPALTHVKALLPDAPGPRLDDALAMIDDLLSIATSFHKTRRIIELLALKARVHELREESEQARNSLREAVTLAAPYGLIRSLADGAGHLTPVMQWLLENEPSPYLQRVCTALKEPGVDGARNHQMSLRTAPAVRLTRREREVLTLLARYMTDREIADSLVISPLTVRTHIEHISEKLEVSGRRAITTRALKLGIIP